MRRDGLTAASLPGGTSIEVGIASPSTGAVVPASPLVVSGTAQIGVAAPLPTDLVLVLDMSGSTGLAGGCGGDQNGDLISNTVLDCELAALRAVNDQLVAAGSVDHVSLVVFGSDSRSADMSPAAGDQLNTAPSADLNGTGGLDVGEVLHSARLVGSTGQVGLFTPITLNGGATSFGAALRRTGAVLSASTATRKLVVFVSDGLHNYAPDVTTSLPYLPAGTIVVTIAAGASSACGTGVDSLQRIATATGGTCTHVANLADLPGVAPSLVKATLTGLSLTVDGVPAAIDTIAPALPLDGPAATTWSTTLSALSSGAHLLCATATGQDVGGVGSVDDCVTVTVNSPPVAVCTSPTVPADATCQASASIGGGSFDPDGDLVGCTPLPPGPYSLGATAVTLTCTDAQGATGTCSGTVTVVDATAPVFTSVPPALCTHRRHLRLGTATATDNCGPAAVTNDAPLHFPCGTTVVTWTATDAAGNTATATQQVVRACGRDEGHGSGHGSDGPGHGSDHGSAGHGSDHGSGHGSGDGGSPSCRDGDGDGDDDEDDSCAHHHRPSHEGGGHHR